MQQTVAGHKRSRLDVDEHLKMSATSSGADEKMSYALHRISDSTNAYVLAVTSCVYAQFSADDIASHHLIWKKVAIEDYLFRKFFVIVSAIEKELHTELVYKPSDLLEHDYVLAKDCINLNENTVTILFSSNNINDAIIERIVNEWISSVISDEAALYWHCVCDQEYIREQLVELGASAFIGNDSILPDIRIMNNNEIVRFLSPNTLEHTFTKLPYSGSSISGMLLQKGVTLISGGGYHGKSTLLKSIGQGVLLKRLGSGKEHIVSVSKSCWIRAEDGRFISSVNCSPFIQSLPVVSKLDPTAVTTRQSSGSLSMAAAVVESIELGCKLFLLDEDTSASNFLIRDSRMRSLISHEPIIPYIYRVNALCTELDISTIAVVGCSGDWFDVMDITVLLDEYVCKDVTKRALSISKTFCTGRVEFNGRGLVHKLEWPLAKRDTSPFGVPQRYVNVDALKEIIMRCSDPEQTSEYLDVTKDGNYIRYSRDAVVIDVTKLETRCSSRSYLNGILLFLMWLVDQDTQNVPFYYILKIYEDSSGSQEPSVLRKYNSNKVKCSSDPNDWLYSYQPTLLDVGYCVNRCRFCSFLYK